jgi:hypothetical protein
MKMKFIIAAILIGLLATSIILGQALLSVQSDYSRIEDSYASSQQAVEFYVAENGKLVAKNQALQLKYNELKLIYPKIFLEIKNLKVKGNRVETFTENIIEQEKQIVKEVRDSIIFDTIQVKIFEYRDTYYDVSGMLMHDSIRMSIHSQDTLVQVVYRGQRKTPWLWIFSKRQLEQVIQCKNPNAQIIYSKHIQIAK